MANVKGSSSFRNAIHSGKHSLLPPKCPFPIPSFSPSYVDFIPTPAIGPKGMAKPREVNSHHLRTSSESILVEEQPSWFDELLNEPETPVRKGGHRRSSSDSFTYVDIANASKLDYISQDDFRYNNMISVPSWGSLDLENQIAVQYVSLFSEPKTFVKPKNWVWDQSLNSMAHQSCIPSVADKIAVQSSPNEADGVASTFTEKQDQVESDPHDPEAAFEMKDLSNAKPCSSETDTKRAKQQFAQRSRVRKLQYIADLERTVQALQAEGTEVTAQLEFVNQQNLILSMENKALMQRLESLAQEHLIKHLEHEVLEREIGRLQVLFQQQLQLSSASHRRANSKDLEAQFGELSLKLGTSAARDLI